ncbi:hypothetical protein MYSTI_05762 [Myxococcus stipitatus DSM 14675]|uniref:Uncharacterized protein n=1 Tax=Myxococcus stipitatus (strain DSM 14675 / JCM 12634 / Mx s8) TaxID=1278073 RepID=L7UG85_MYXSD|nr:hypothetical protein [Myxococcus stipitatus]AGC47038.1 hypothetical protein MYSTI_05762 [Myxococcus stipitatus DSM 14675]
MSSDWRVFCRGARVAIDGDELIVDFENQRSHRVRVRETDEVIEFHAVVARAAAVRDIPDLPLRLWRYNRASQLVSFRLDTRGRVYAEGWVPKAGLTAEEFQLTLRHVAAESDRLEYLLTGRDAE